MMIELPASLTIVSPLTISSKSLVAPLSVLLTTSAPLVIVSESIEYKRSSSVVSLVALAKVADEHIQAVGVAVRTPVAVVIP